MLKIISFTIMLFLTGCAIKPVSNEKAKAVPLDRVLDQEFFKLDSAKVSVIIKRDQGHVGSACKTQVLVDGKAVANLKVSEKINIYLTPEKHILSSIPLGICGGGISELQIDLSAKKPSTYRIGFDANATHKIQPTVF